MKNAIATILAMALIFIGCNSNNYTIKDEFNPKNCIKVIGKGRYLVDTATVTDRMGFFDGSSEQYNDGKVNTAFISYGWVDGKYFENKLVRNGKVVVGIDDILTPGDGTLDVFISETFEDGVPYIDVFLDSEWKQKFGTVNIYYGKDFRHSTVFDFSASNELEKGLYHNRVKDDISRFALDADPVQKSNGFLLGDLTIDDWRNKRPEGKTVIFFQ